jgi:hypothetical protein
MRTNIVLNNELALREFIANHKRRDVRALREKVKLREDYNYKSLRSDFII